MQGRYAQKVQKVCGPNRSKTKEELDKATKELTETQQEMQKLRSQLPDETEYHGWIWLFLRQPAEKAAAR
jgi:hypothetical protein